MPNRIEEMQQDAARWRWISERLYVENDSDEYGRWFSSIGIKDGFIYPPGSPYYETVNQAIDAAMENSK